MICVRSNKKKRKGEREAFFLLVKAGLWEKDIRLSPFLPIDFGEIHIIAEEQSVIGLIAAGIEHARDLKPSKQDILSFMTDVLFLEKRNIAMNGFIKNLFGRMKEAGIYSLLVKGQGVAQCYHRPEWRASGDVDLFLDNANYIKAKSFLPSMADTLEQERDYTKHVAMSIDSWDVELHGNMRAEITSQMDRLIDEVQKDCFENGGVREWDNDGMRILLPSPDNDAIIIFTHILHHFYRGGIGLRQFCDWCRLLFVYREAINPSVLEKRLRSAGIMKEWVSFGQFVVHYLGMPPEAMPLYRSPEKRDRKKIDRICSFILSTGNFGRNRDQSFRVKYSFLVRKAIALWRNGGDIIRHFLLFPRNSLIYFIYFLSRGVKAAVKGVG